VEIIHAQPENLRPSQAKVEGQRDDAIKLRADNMATDAQIWRATILESAQPPIRLV
jgi:hypothetical protein